MRTDQLVLILYLLTLVFDFRRADGDDGSLVVVLGLGNLALGVALLLIERRFRRSVLLWTIPFVLLIVAATATGLLHGQPIYDVVSRTVPVAIFIMAIVIVASFRSGRDNGWMISVVAVVALVAVFWKILFGFAYYGLNIENVRYQIIAGSLPLVFAYGLTGFLVHRRRLMMLATAAALMTVALSVTRTYLVVFAISAIAAILSMPRSRFSSVTKRTIATAAVLLVGVTLIAVFEPEVAARWITRFGSYDRIGFDLTGATRIAEATYQIQRLDQDGFGLLFGFGHAAETRFAGTAADQVRSVLGAQGVDYLGHGYGHNFYLGLIYVGGILFGGPVILAFAAMLLKARSVARRQWSNLTKDEQFTLIWGLAGFAGYTAYGLLGGTFGDRAGSFYFGISAGLILRVTESARRRVALC
jgi:hypothetical protein